MSLDSIRPSVAPQVSRALPKVDSIPLLKPTSADAGEQAPQAVAEVERVRASSEAINRVLEDAGRNLRFEVDEASGLTVVQVVESSSGEVLRQMPSEEMLRVAAQLAAGATLNSIGIDERT